LKEKHKLSKHASIIILAILLLVFFVITLNITSEDLQDYFQSSMIFGIVGFLFLYAVKSITMTFPNSVLYIAAGFLFPTWIAILVTYIGLTLSLSVGYWAGRKLGETNVYDSFAKQKHLHSLIQKYGHDLPLLCFMLRLLSLPFGFANFFFGALKMPFFKYVLISLLGVTPIMLPIVFSGASITNPLSPKFLIPFGISVAIIFIIFVIFKRKTAAISTS